MTKKRLAPEPMLASDGRHAAVLRDEVLIRVDVATGVSRSIRVPFAARHLAVAPKGLLVAVVGDGHIATYDAVSDEPSWEQAVDLGEVSRIAIDDDGFVAISSAAERRAVLANASGIQGESTLPEGFHAWLTLVSRKGAAPVAHLGLEGGHDTGGVLSFDGSGPVELESPPDLRGSFTAGSLLGLHGPNDVWTYRVDVTGNATVSRRYAVDDIERLIASPGGACALTVTIRWSGTCDVVSLEVIDLATDARRPVHADDLGPGDALAIDDSARIVAATALRDPGRVIIRSLSTAASKPHEIDIDAEVTTRRR